MKFFTTLFTILFFNLLYSQTKEYPLYKTQETITIDGELNEAVWKNAYVFLLDTDNYDNDLQ